MRLPARNAAKAFRQTVNGLRFLRWLVMAGALVVATDAFAQGAVQASVTRR